MVSPNKIRVHHIPSYHEERAELSCMVDMQGRVIRIRWRIIQSGDTAIRSLQMQVGFPIHHCIYEYCFPCVVIYFVEQWQRAISKFWRECQQCHASTRHCGFAACNQLGSSNRILTQGKPSQSMTKVLMRLLDKPAYEKFEKNFFAIGCGNLIAHCRALIAFQRRSLLQLLSYKVTNTQIQQIKIQRDNQMVPYHSVERSYVTTLILIKAS